MIEPTFEFPGPHRIVVSDANVLYSRVLRDYILYAASQEIVTIVWSTEILGEAIEHMIKNIPSFNLEAANYLLDVLRRAYQESWMDPEPEDFRRLERFDLPDEDDRHVIATALAAEADAICTNDKTGFPARVLDVFGMEAVTPDALLYDLVERYPQAMLEVHCTTARSLPGATDQSTIQALQRAGAIRTATAMAVLLGPL